MDENSYSQVISKFRDPHTGEMVNSFKYRSVSPHQIKWCPEISLEERLKKKREREDDYLHQLDPSQRPILVVKNKQIFKNMNHPGIFDRPEDENKYFKITKNTDVIEDINDEIKTHYAYPNRNTIVTTADSQSPNNKQIVKIEGIEYLPEGFLELDPLLLKDEYEFETRIHENFFTEEQRKIKALRRKQYAQKHHQKMRDVTIYVVDEFKDKIIEKLEEWYFEHKRRMNQDELAEFAKQMGTDEQTMTQLQDLYLKQKKVQNTQKLKEYLMNRSQKNKNSLPESLRKYFKKHHPGQEYSEVNSRVYEDKSVFHENPHALNSYKTRKLRKPRSASNLKREKFGNTNAWKQLIMDRDVNSELNDQSHVDNSHYNHQHSLTEKKQQTNQNLHNSFAKQSVQNNQVHYTFKDQKQSGIELSGENKLKLYFDEELNVILDKLQGAEQGAVSLPSKVTLCAECNRLYGNRINNLNCVHLQALSINQQQQYQKQTFQPEIIEHQSFNQQKQSQIKKTTFKKEEIDEGPLEIKQSIVVSQKKSQVKSVSKPKNTVQSNQDPDKDLTLIAVNDEGSAAIVHKLTPVQVGNEIFFQTIEEIFEPNGDKKVSVVTRNQEGDIFSVQNVKPSLTTATYSNTIVEKNSENIKKSLINRISTINQNQMKKSTINEKKITIVIKNKDGEIISEQKGKPTISLISKDNSIHENVFSQKFSVISNKKSQNQTIKLHTIGYQQIGNEFYNQIIQEQIDNSGRHKTTLIIKSADGRIVSQIEIPQEKLGSYYTAEIEQLPKNPTQCSILIKNNNGSTITKQSFNIPQNKKTTRNVSLGYQLIGEEYYHQIVEEQIDQNGQKKTTLITKSENGEIISAVEIPEQQNANELFSEVVFGQSSNEEKTLTLQTKNQNNEIVSQQEFILTVMEEDPIKKDIEEIVLSPDCVLVSVLNENNEVIAQQILQPTLDQHKSFTNFEGVTKEDIQQDGKVSVLKDDNFVFRAQTLNPVLIGSSYYYQVVEELIEEGKKETIIKTFDENGEMISRVEVPNAEGENYFSKVGEDKVNQEGKRTILLETVNEKGKTISSKLFIPDANIMINNEQYVEVANIETDNMGNKKISFIKRDTIGKQTIKQSKKPSTIGKKSFVPQMSLSNEIKKAVIENERSQTVAQRQSVISMVPKIHTILNKYFELDGDKINQQMMSKQSEIDKKFSEIRKSSPSPKNSNFTQKKITVEKKSDVSPKQSFIEKNKKETAIKKESVISSKKETTIKEEIKIEKVPSVQEIKQASVKQIEMYKQPSNRSIKQASAKQIETKPKSIVTIIEEEKKIDINENRDLEKESQLMKQSDELKHSLQDYINILNQRKPSNKKLMSNIDNELLREQIKKVFEEEKGKLGDDIIRKMEKKQNNSLIDEFYEFCQNELPNDSKYKESILFVSLFYYFIEKKKSKQQIQCQY